MKEYNQIGKQERKRLSFIKKYNIPKKMKNIFTRKCKLMILSISVSLISILISLYVLYFDKKFVSEIHNMKKIVNQTIEGQMQVFQNTINAGLESQINLIQTKIDETLESHNNTLGILVENNLESKMKEIKNKIEETIDSQFQTIKTNVDKSIESQINITQAKIETTLKSQLETHLNSTQKNIVYLKLIKENDEWKILSNELTKTKLYQTTNFSCIGDGVHMNCLKIENDIFYFVKCISEKCSVYGTPKSQKKSDLIFDYGQGIFKLEIQEENHSITSTIKSGDEKNNNNVYGKFIIYGQGKVLKEAKEIEVFNYKGFLNIENLVILATRNIVGYANNQFSVSVLHNLKNPVEQAIHNYKSNN